MNADFNFENYERYYEDEENGEEIEKEEEAVRNNQPANGLHDLVDENNILYNMEKQIKLDAHFKANYQQWLEDEVWTYFD